MSCHLAHEIPPSNRFFWGDVSDDLLYGYLQLATPDLTAEGHRTKGLETPRYKRDVESGVNRAIYNKSSSFKPQDKSSSSNPPLQTLQPPKWSRSLPSSPWLWPPSLWPPPTPSARRSTTPAVLVLTPTWPPALPTTKAAAPMLTAPASPAVTPTRLSALLRTLPARARNKLDPEDRYLDTDTDTDTNSRQFHCVSGMLDLDR